MFHFRRRVPNELKSRYTSPRIAFSLPTRSSKVAEARARKAAAQLDEYWYHLRCQDATLPGKQMLREQGLSSAEATAQAPFVSSASVLLSGAVGIYLQQTCAF
ncbi:DUF6538 domain-containing protein, partial [Roseovarius sp.]|uniref:DUF6538 domain-containing protein n=1 Tax=Roseovarius sp. TaxID=1486281 RepID=UPI00356B31BE